MRFSVTVRQDKRVRAAIDAIADDAWQPIPYWLFSPEVSGADVAEASYTAFTGKDAIPVRLIVRRVRPTPGSQLALFTTWSYHAFVTDRTGQTLELEADHRRHAVVEQVIAELKSAGLAHLPSGHFMANAAWLALAVMAHKPRRAVGQLAGPDLDAATAATLRRRVFTVPGRPVRTGRRRHLRLPDTFIAALMGAEADILCGVPYGAPQRGAGELPQRRCRTLPAMSHRNSRNLQGLRRFLQSAQRDGSGPAAPSRGSSVCKRTSSRRTRFERVISTV